MPAWQKVEVVGNLILNYNIFLFVSKRIVVEKKP
jgi:hypothetical protein